MFTNSAGTATTPAATLTVNPATPPTITTQPANQTVTAGQTATFSVVASGSVPLSYQWQKNNGTGFLNISGATAASYTTPTTTTADSGSTFQVVVSNAAGPVTSNAAMLTVNPAPSPTVNFNSGFAGATTLTLNGGATISGTRLRLTDGGTNEARSAFFTTLVNVQSFTNDFSFQLTSPNGDGFTFTIQNSGLTALGPSGGGLGYGPDQPTKPPGIGKSVAVKFDLTSNYGEGNDSTGMYTNGASPTFPAIDMTSSGVNLHSGDVMNVHMTYDGTTLAMTITDATAGKSFTASWAVNIPSVVGASSAYAGFTAGTGSLTATQEILTWAYSSGPAQSTLPTITTQPANQTVIAGQTATFSAAATGSPTPTVQWQVSTDGGVTFSSIPGATSTTLSFTTALSQNGNQYQAVFTNSAGTATTTGATLTVNPATPPTITTQPANQTVTAGQTATFTAAATGSPTPTVQWQVSTDSGATFSILSGATSTTLSFTTASSQNGNQYHAVFTNSAGTATTTAATLTVNPATTKVPIQYEPENLMSSSVSSGPKYRAFAWTGFTDGKGTVLDAKKVGDNVTITLNVPQAATFDVKVAVRMFSSGGIMQLSVNGTNVGPGKDQYVSSSAWAEFDIGNVTLSSAGNQSFKFTVVGKNSASNGYSISFDYIKLTPQ